MIPNGVDANAEDFNNSFMSKTNDTSTVGKVSLNNPSSTAIVDLQATVNSVSTGAAASASAIGAPTSANTPSQIVKRGTAGEFAAGAITATSFAGPLTGNVTGNASGSAASITGVNPIANGGTGASTQAAALTALAGTQSSGKFLRSDGTNTALSLIQASDVPTLNQNTTGTALNVTGIVAKVNGGSGQDNTNVVFPTTGTLATLAGAQTLTNKLLTTPEITDAILLDYQSSTPATPATSKAKIYFKADGNAYTLNSAGVEQQVGSGASSGGGSTNYVGNPNFKAGVTTGWSLFNTTLTNKNPTGSIVAGASSITTFAVTSTNPLLTTSPYNLQVGSSGAITAGNGFISDAMTIDRERVASILSSFFSYEVVSGSTNLSLTGTNAGSFGVFFYDVAAAAWVPNWGAYAIMQGSGPARATGIGFQSNGNVANIQYRMAIVCITATAGAASINFNDFQLGPQQVVVGSAMRDLVNAGVNIITSTGTAPTKPAMLSDLVRWGQVGDHGRFKGELRTAGASGTIGTGDYLFEVPGKLAFDANKVSFYTTVIGAGNSSPPSTLGSAWFQSGGAAQIIGVIVPYDATHFRIAGDYTTNAGNGVGTGFLGASYGPILSANASLSYDFEAPIAGWSCGVTMSADAGDCRTVAASGNFSNANLTGTSTNLSLAVTRDTHGAAGATSYIIPTPGEFAIDGNVTGNSATSAVNDQYFSISINGSVVRSSTTSAAYARSTPASWQGQCKANDVITWQGSTSAGNFGIANATFSSWSVKKIGGSTQSAPTDTIAASYYMSANFTASATVPMNFDAKEYDTHNAVTVSPTAWKFTAPYPALFLLTGYCQTTAAAAGQSIKVYKGGTAYKNLAYSATNGPSMNGTIRLLAGESIDVRPDASNTYFGGALSATYVAWLAITKIGN